MVRPVIRADTLNNSVQYQRDSNHLSQVIRRAVHRQLQLYQVFPVWVRVAPVLDLVPVLPEPLYVGQKRLQWTIIFYPLILTVTAN